MAGFSVWKCTVKDTVPPSIWRSRTKPNETMSRERPGNLTFFSASSTCSWVAMAPLLFQPPFVRLTDDRDGLFGGADDLDHVEIGRADETPLEHGRADPVDQSGPHCTDQNQRMLFHVL